MLSQEDKQYLLILARSAFENKESNISDIPAPLLEKGATFISIYRDNQLINSVGSLNEDKEIFQDIIDNALALSQENSENVEIEISLVKDLKKLKFETQEELFSQIISNIHGIAIKKDNKIATLLPQIWNQIKDKEEFLNQICYKLKLEKDSWKTNSDILTYETETFREN